MRKLCALALALLCAGACESYRAKDPRITAAKELTAIYERSRFANWGLYANAAGRDCGVLYIQTSNTMGSSMVEAIHYGFGQYDAYKGGIHQYYHERAFRGAVYKDATGRSWQYGIDEAEVKSIVPCR
ncbi:MAG TPA: hypothetical protein VF618_13575 [Thermoanaerobaculia bacterium]